MRRNRDRTSFSTGDMTAGATIAAVVVTAGSYVALSGEPAPGVDIAPIRTAWILAATVAFVALGRAAAIKVRIDRRGVLVRNFWRSRLFEWDEFESFSSPAERSLGAGTCLRACLVTTSGREFEITATEVRGWNLFRGKPQPEVEDLVARMSAAADAARPRSPREESGL